MSVTRIQWRSLAIKTGERIKTVARFVSSHGPLMIGAAFGLPVMMVQIKSETARATLEHLKVALDSEDIAQAIIDQLKDRPGVFFRNANQTVDDSGGPFLPSEQLLLICYYAERGFTAFSAQELAEDFQIENIVKVVNGLEGLVKQGFYKQQGENFFPVTGLLEPQQLFLAAKNTAVGLADYRTFHHAGFAEELESQPDSKKPCFKTVGDFFAYSERLHKQNLEAEKAFFGQGHRLDNPEELSRLSPLERRLLCNLLENELEVMTNEFEQRQFLDFWRKKKPLDMYEAIGRSPRGEAQMLVQKRSDDEMDYTINFLKWLSSWVMVGPIDKARSRSSPVAGSMKQLARGRGSGTTRVWISREMMPPAAIVKLGMQLDEIADSGSFHQPFWLFGQSLGESESEEAFNQLAQRLGSNKRLYIIERYSDLLPRCLLAVALLKEALLSDKRIILVKVCNRQIGYYRDDVRKAWKASRLSLMLRMASNIGENILDLMRAVMKEHRSRLLVDALENVLKKIKKTYDQENYQEQANQFLHNSILLKFDRDVAASELHEYIRRTLSEEQLGRANGLLGQAWCDFPLGEEPAPVNQRFFDAVLKQPDEQKSNLLLLLGIYHHLLILLYLDKSQEDKDYYQSPRYYAVFILPFLLDCLAAGGEGLTINLAEFRQLPKRLENILSNPQAIFAAEFNFKEQNQDSLQRAVDYLENKLSIPAGKSSQTSQLIKITSVQLARLGLIDAAEIFEQMIAPLVLNNPDCWRLSLPKELFPQEDRDVYYKVAILGDYGAIAGEDKTAIKLNPEHALVVQLVRQIEEQFDREMIDQLPDGRGHAVKQGCLDLNRPIRRPDLFQETEFTGIIKYQFQSSAVLPDGAYQLDLGYPTTGLYQLPAEQLPRERGYFLAYRRGQKLFILGDRNRVLVQDSMEALTSTAVDCVRDDVAIRPINYYRGIDIRSWRRDQVVAAQQLFRELENISGPIFEKLFGKRHVIFAAGEETAGIVDQDVVLPANLADQIERLRQNPRDLAAWYFALLDQVGETADYKTIAESLYDGKLEAELLRAITAELLRRDEEMARVHRSMEIFTRIHREKLTDGDIARVWRGMLQAIKRQEIGRIFSDKEIMPIPQLREEFKGIAVGLIPANLLAFDGDGRLQLNRAVMGKGSSRLLMVFVGQRGQPPIIECFNEAGERINDRYLDLAASINQLEGSFFDLDLSGLRQLPIEEARAEILRINDFLARLMTMAGQQAEFQNWKIGPAAKTEEEKKFSRRFLEIMLKQIYYDIPEVRQLSAGQQQDMFLGLGLAIDSRQFETAEQVMEYLRIVVPVAIRAIRDESDLGGALFDWLETVAALAKEKLLVVELPGGKKAISQSLPNGRTLSLAAVSALLSYYAPTREEKVVIAAPLETETRPAGPRAVAEEENIISEIESSLAIFSERLLDHKQIDAGVKEALVDLLGGFAGHAKAKQLRENLMLLLALFKAMGKRTANISEVVNRGERITEVLRSRAKFDIEFQFTHNEKTYRVIVVTRDHQTLGGQACIRIGIHEQQEQIVSFRLDLNSKPRQPQPEIDIDMLGLRHVMQEIFEGGYHFVGYLPGELSKEVNWINMVLKFRRQVIYPLLRVRGKTIA